MKRYWVILICIILLSGFQDKRLIVGAYPSTGLATWYNPDYNALGKIYRKGEFTCAMRKRDFGKKLLVCNTENNKCVVVRHDDFGPAFNHFTTGKIIDLSRDAFLKIADLEKGVIRVRIGEICPGEVNDNINSGDTINNYL